jgi:hypothetical protein
MFEAFCVECGRGEEEGVLVVQNNGATESGLDQMPGEAIRTKFTCTYCDVSECVETGVMPTKRAAKFELRETESDDTLTVRVDSTEISFVDIDEQRSSSTHYTSAGIRNTARIHRVHIHAVNPPTIEKGKHRLKIGEYLDAEMTLTSVRYYEGHHRTLEFQRVLDRTGQRGTEAAERVVGSD